MPAAPTVNTKGLLSIRVGVVKHAAPTRNLYRIYPTDCVLDEPYIGVPAGTRDLIVAGATALPTYTVGDTVLFIQTSAISQTATPIVLILCVIPATVSDAVSDTRTALVGDPELQGLDTYISDTYNAFSQDTWLAKGGSWQGYNPDNIYQGDYVLASANASILLSDRHIDITAGSVRHSLCELTGTDTSSALFQNRYNMAEDYQQQLLSGYLLTTRKLAGHVSESYTKGQPSVFPFLEQYSNLLCGYRRSMLDTEGCCISAIGQDNTGGLDVRASRCINIEKTAYIPAYTPVNDAPIISNEAIKNVTPKPDLTTLNELVAAGVLIDNSSIIDGADWEIGSIPMVPESAGIGEDLTDSDGGNSIPANSCFRFLEDGSIVLRDAWGSEIRLSRGNIQLSAANNMIQIAGRDSLNIVSGVYAVNAGKEVEIAAATEDVVLSAGKCLKVHSANELQLVGNTIALASRSTVSVTCEQLGVRATTAAITGNTISVAAQNVQIVGESQCLLGTTKSIVGVYTTGIVLGGAGVDVRSNLSVSKKGCSISGVLNSELNEITISTPSTAAQITAEGNVVVDGSVNTNSWLQAAGSVYASSMAAHDVTSWGGIYKLRKPPSKARMSETKEFSVKLGLGALFVGMRDRLASSYKQIVGEIFSKKSKACTIIEPAFSSKGVGTTPCAIATIEYEGKKQYIYPGDSFWNNNGLQIWQEDYLGVGSAEPREITGTAKLRLNKPNIE